MHLIIMIAHVLACQEIKTSSVSSRHSLIIHYRKANNSDLFVPLIKTPQQKKKIHLLLSLKYKGMGGGGGIIFISMTI